MSWPAPGRLVAVMALVVGAGFAWDPARAPDAPVRTHPVVIRGFAFAPLKLTVAIGDTIAWTNEDLAVHTITPDTARWDSGDLANGKHYRVVASKKGTLSYHCEFHPSMKGTLIIQ